MAYQLPKLPYSYSALEPYIDARTMEIHHTKHHTAYITNLNTALEKYPQLAAKSVEQLLREINQVPAAIKQAVINHGGGHANHTLFWQVMAAKSGGEPKGGIAAALKQAFGDFATLKEKLSQVAITRFGSGWGWLVVKSDGSLAVYSTPNQESPLMQGDTPLLGIDVWEHAYYLKYQNRRPDYVVAWWNVVNWEKVSAMFSQATSTTEP